MQLCTRCAYFKGKNRLYSLKKCIFMRYFGLKKLFRTSNPNVITYFKTAGKTPQNRFMSHACNIIDIVVGISTKKCKKWKKAVLWTYNEFHLFFFLHYFFSISGHLFLFSILFSCSRVICNTFCNVKYMNNTRYYFLKCNLTFKVRYLCYTNAIQIMYILKKVSQTSEKNASV